MYDFRTFTFGRGSHRTREDGMCLMEAVAYVAGEGHTDSPECACPVLSDFLQSWNDSIVDDDRRRELLAPFVFRLVGTKAGKQVEQERARMAADWLVRVLAPSVLALDEHCATHADALRAMPGLSMDNVPCVARVLRGAYEKVVRFPVPIAHPVDRAAAHSAKVSAHGSAYKGLARDAYRVVRCPAGGVRSTDLNRVIREMQDSAWHLVDRMIRLTETQEPDVSGLRGVQALKK